MPKRIVHLSNRLSLLIKDVAILVVYPVKNLGLIQLFITFILIILGLMLLLIENHSVSSVGLVVTISFLTGTAYSLLITKKILLSSDEIAPLKNNDQTPVSTTEKNKFEVTVLNEITDKFHSQLDSLNQVLQEITEQSSDIVERYEILTENLAAAVVIRDRHGRITYCSPYTEVLTGHPLSTIYASPDDFFVSSAHLDDKDKFKRALSVANLGEAFQFRYRFIHKTGIEMWAEMRIVPVLGSDGEAIATLAITLDVTSSVRYQQQVEEKNRDLQDFSYMISHDLKAPIFTISGMINLLKEDHRDKFQGEAADILDHIEKATSRLNTLVQAVLDYAKVTSRQNSVEPVNLGAVINEVLDDYSIQLKENNCLLEVDKEFHEITGDRVMVYQIISNLVGNAIKYRDPSRDLEISLKNVPNNTGSAVKLQISDNGIGIPEDKLSSIFRPFYRVKGDAKIEGAGIGLACVKKLLYKLNGDITVTSSVGRGTSFLLTFPSFRNF